MIYLVRKPLESSWVKSKEQHYQTKDDAYNAAKAERQNRLNALLDKANSKGWESLSKRELDELDELANGRKPQGSSDLIFSNMTCAIFSKLSVLHPAI